MLSRPTKNVLQLGLGFLLFFIAFNSQGYIQEAVIAGVPDEVGIDKHAGYHGLATYYGVFTVANLVIAPVIDIMGPRWAMTIGAILTTAYEIGFFHINNYYFFITSALSGFGAALMWPALGTYMTLNSTEKTIDRNSSLVWALSQASQVFGGLVLLIIFTYAETGDNSISPEAVKIIAVSFSIILIFSTVVFMLLPHPASMNAIDDEVVVRHNRTSFASTFDLLCSKHMVYMAVVFSYTGIVQSLWTSIYPTAISFTERLGKNNNSLMAYSAMSSGLGQILLCLWVADGRIAIPRRYFVFVGFILHLIAFTGIFVNFPAESSIRKTFDSSIIEPRPFLVLFVSFVLGFGDGCWNTQIYALVGDLFPHCSNQAFAIFNFYQSALTCASLFYSSHLSLDCHIFILTAVAFMAVSCFFKVELMGRPSYTRRSSIVDPLTPYSLKDPGV